MTLPSRSEVSVDALVTDAQTRTAVAGLRGLGRSGLGVLAVGPTWTAAGLWSSYATTSAVGPTAEDDPTGFTETLARLAAWRGPLVVYAGTEASIDAILRARPSLPPQALLPYPGHAPLAALRDKGSLAALAADVGLATPRTLFEGIVGDLPHASLPDGCVVKPARPGSALATAQVVKSRIELQALARALPDRELVLVQERIRGALASLAMVVGRDGRLVARFQQVAHRTWPRDAGISSLAVSVAPDEQLAARAARMLHAAGYWGLAQLQFIDSGRERALIDVNPRFYGSLPLALACGVNLPAAWHEVVVGQMPRSPGPYQVGIGYRWLEADLTAAARGEPERLVRGGPRPRTGAMWSGDDPAAAALLAFQALRVRLARLRSRVPRTSILGVSRANFVKYRPTRDRRQ